MAWSSPFYEPVEAKGRPLKTFREAAAYIQRLPKKADDQEHWRTAVDCLIHAAEVGGPWTQMARIAMLHALAEDREVLSPFEVEAAV